MSDWRHDQGYVEPQVCASCENCVMQRSHVSNDRLYCMRGYDGRHDDIYASNGTEESRRFWDFAEGRDVNPDGTCRYWRKK